MADPEKRTGIYAQPGCRCEACMPHDLAKPETIRMILCAICGNKRCPHATDHRNRCTGSNQPGQKGSSWENYTPGSILPPEPWPRR